MKASQSNIPALFNTIIFVLGALLLFGVGILMGFTALASVLAGKDIKAAQTIFLVAFSFEGLVLVAAAFFSFQKYLQKPSADEGVSFPIPNWLITGFAVVVGASVLIGYLVSSIRMIDWLVLPILTIPAVVLPLVILLAVGTKRLPLGTRSQTWSILGLAMTLGPLVLFVLEIFVAIVIFFGAVVYIMSQPALASRLQALSQQIRVLGPQSEAVLELLSPFLTKPGVIITTLVYMSVLVPALEEIFKPIGVWLFAGRLESQAQGFTLGALSGAGYALIETIGVSGQSTEWASLLLSRMGTGLLHITTSALLGAAIVLAWRERRYVRLLGTYLFAVLLHGLWNSLAILFTFSSIAESLGQGGQLSSIQPAMIIAMVMLAIGLLVLLVESNRKIRKAILPGANSAGDS